MYYIRSIMKNTIFKLIEYVYYFSLLTLLILYLFPGSLIGYFLHGDLEKQPNIVNNPEKIREKLDKLNDNAYRWYFKNKKERN